MENFFKIGVLVTLFITAVSFSYYFVVFLPQNEQNILNEQKQEQMIKTQQVESQRNMLEICLADAKVEVTAFLEKNCKVDGQNYDCPVSMDVKSYKDELNNKCYKLYPQN
jgi:peroxiredoxin family protein